MWQLIRTVLLQLTEFFTRYNYLNASGTVTDNVAPMYGFLNTDFTFNSSFMPAYTTTLDDTTSTAGCTYSKVKQYMSVTSDDCFIYDAGGGSSPQVYKVCAGGVRTLLYTSPSVTSTTLSTSTLGDYFFIAERVNTNGPYAIRKVSTTMFNTVDATFSYSNATTSASVSQILEAPDGTVYIIEGPNSTLKRLTATGSVDATFTSHANTAQIALQSTGKVIAGGTSTNTSSLTRYNLDGTVDATFNTITDLFVRSVTGGAPYVPTATRGSVSRIQINANDEIYIAGNFNEVNGYYSNALGKLSANGVYDNAFRLNLKGGTITTSGVTDLQIQPDGKLLVALHGGQFGWGSLFQSGLVRLLPNGKLDTPINNTATNLDAKVPTETDLLISLQSMSGANTPVIAYDLADYANFNLPGYNANPSFNGDTIAGLFAPSELEYSLANKMYYKASGNLLTAFRTTDASITGTADVVWSVTLPTPTSLVAVYDLQVSADGNYLAVVQGQFDAAIYNAKTGALLNSTLNPNGFSAAYQPISPNYLFVLSGNNINSTAISFRRFTATGTTPVSIALPTPATSIGTPSNQARVSFFTPVDFYISDIRYIYKLKLVSSTTNAPDPNGTKAIFDTSFGTGGKLDTWTFPNFPVNPQYDGLTVGSDGTIYIIGDYNGCFGAAGSTGANVAKIAPVGSTIDIGYIQSVSIPNSTANQFSTSLTNGWYDMALGQKGTCFTAPDITSSTHSNICPATTADLTTLTDAGTLPAGSTLVWSMNNPPLLQVIPCQI
jgi:hypothetical protein